jgi:phosphatidylglycerophosphatase A
LKKTLIFIATGAYSGYSPFAPGTAGTLAAIPLYLLLSPLDPWLYGAIVLALLPISFWSAGEAEKIFGTKDSKQIVIDEILGYFVTMFMAPAGWVYVIAGFFLFRIFDIAKPYPVNRFEKLGGGVGVVMDDIMAGVYAALVLQLLVYTDALSFIGG